MPHKKEVKAVEDAIYSMEDARYELWAWPQDKTGSGKRQVELVAHKLEKLATALAALEAKAPAWPRLAEYKRRIAYLERAHEQQKAHYAGVAAAKQEAADAAVAAKDAAFAAKRTTDDGQPHAYHKKLVGSFAFAPTAIAASDASGRGHVTSIDVTAPLFGRVYLRESPWNMLHSDFKLDCTSEGSSAKYWVAFSASVDGGPERELEKQRLSLEDFQRRTSFALSTKGSLTAGGVWDDNEVEKYAPFSWLASVVPSLRPGKNRVTLAARAYCSKGKLPGHVVAKGELTVNATDAGIREVGKRATFSFKQSTHAGAELARLRDKVLKTYAGEWELVEFRTLGEWEPYRNSYGVVLPRRAPAFALLRKKAGYGCKLVKLLLDEPFDGNSYGPVLKFALEQGRPFVCQAK